VVDSLEEYALISGVPTAQMEIAYPSIVQNMRSMKNMLRDPGMQSSMPEQYKHMMLSVVGLYDAMEEVGLFDLQR
jgi:hypothetical protein